MIYIKNERVRDALRYALPLIVIPAAVILGAAFNFGSRQYIAVTVLVTVLALLLFAAGFEKKATGNRRLVIVAVMSALSAVGRFVPLLKPVTALTVLTAVYFGPEAGFLTGALSALISNMFFGQGPWTPFQMLAWGLIGFVAGLAAPLLKKGKLPLVIYGIAAGAAFSLIMDVWTVMWYGAFDISAYLAAIVTALPYTAMYAVSNAVFLWFLAKPLGEKFGRVKLRYRV